MIIKNAHRQAQVKTLAFDVYGTLIDTSGVGRQLEALIGEKAVLFMNTWRLKQLEYSFRRGLMQNYVDFPACTRQALDYTCEFLKTGISPENRGNLMQAYTVLPAYPDVESGLKNLRELDCRMFAFSNGRHDSVVKLLQNAGIDDFFEGVVSVDDIKVYKPSPAVYAYFMRRAGSSASESFLISGNPFDVIGAASAGMGSIWIKRIPDAVFDPWEIQPSVIIESVSDISEVIKSSN